MLLHVGKFVNLKPRCFEIAPSTNPAKILQKMFNLTIEFFLNDFN